MSIDTSRSIQGRFAELETNWDDLTPHEKFDKLDVYYSNNKLYDELASYARDNEIWLEAIKPLRNPTHRSIEFFASKLCAGKPKIVVPKGREVIAPHIEQFLTWSGFQFNKRPMLRKDALFGNLFRKVIFDGTKIIQTQIDPKYVTDFEEDERGFLLWIRIDIPQAERRTYTEYWFKGDGFNGYVATWVHTGDKDTPLDRLGDPKTYAFLSDYGIDFIPIVHTKFINTGEKWGLSRIDHAIAKINEWDRKATVLSELMFQSKAFFFVTSGLDKDGIATPITNIQPTTEGEVISMGKYQMMAVQGGNIQLSIPDFAWDSFNNIVNSDGEQLEQDLPELRYYVLKENELSGIAMRTLLAGALDVATEAEEAFVGGQERANEMALSMGKFFGLFPSAIGEYTSGGFTHTLQFEEIIPVNSQADKIQSLASMANIDIPLPIKMQLAGFTPEEIALISVKS